MIGWLSYQVGARLARADVDFYGLVVAAMMRADSVNAAKLRAALPDVWEETQARYDAGGGVLDGETLTVAMLDWLARREVVKA